MHTTSSEIFKVLSGFIEETGHNGKIALEFVLMALPDLQAEIQV